MRANDMPKVCEIVILCFHVSFERSNELEANIMELSLRIDARDSSRSLIIEADARLMYSLVTTLTMLNPVY